MDAETISIAFATIILAIAAIGTVIVLFDPSGRGEAEEENRRLQRRVNFLERALDHARFKGRRK